MPEANAHAPSWRGVVPREAPPSDHPRRRLSDRNEQAVQNYLRSIDAVLQAGGDAEASDRARELREASLSDLKATVG